MCSCLGGSWQRSRVKEFDPWAQPSTRQGSNQDPGYEVVYLTSERAPDATVFLHGIDRFNWDQSRFGSPKFINQRLFFSISSSSIELRSIRTCHLVSSYRRNCELCSFWRSLARRLNRAFEISASREANAFRGAVSSRRSKSSAFPWVMRSIGRSSRCVYVFVKLVANELGWQTGNVDQGTIDEIKVTMGKPQPLLL